MASIQFAPLSISPCSVRPLSNNCALFQAIRVDEVYDSSYDEYMPSYESLPGLFLFDPTKQTLFDPSMDICLAQDPNDFTILPNGRVAVVSTDETGGILEIWDIPTRTCVTRFTAHSYAALSVFSLTDDRIATIGQGDGGYSELKIWDARAYDFWDTTAFECMFTLWVGNDEVTHLVELPSDRLLLVVDTDLILYNLATQTREAILKGHARRIYATQLLPKNRVATIARDNTIRIWDLSTLACVHIQANPEKGKLGSLQVLPDNRLVFTNDRQTLHVLDTETFMIQESISLKTHAPDDDIVADDPPGITLLPDGRWLCATEKGFYTVEDTKAPEIRAHQRCKKIKENLMAAAWNPACPRGEWLVMDEAARD